MATIRRRFAGCAGVGVLLLAGGLRAEPAVRAPVDLSLRWQEGRRYVMRVSTAQESEISDRRLAEIVPRRSSLEYDFSTVVLPRASRNPLTLELEYRALRMRQEFPGGVAAFDSRRAPAADSGNPLAFLRDLVGIKLQCRLDAQNRIASVSGLDLAEGAGAGLSNVTQLARQPLDKQLVDGLVNDAIGYEWLLRGPTAPGESWYVSRSIPMGAFGVAYLQVKCTLDGMEDFRGNECAAISFEGRVDPGADGAPAQPGQQGTLRKARIRGRMWFDPALGMPQETFSFTTAELELGLPGIAEPVVNRLRQSVTVRLVEFGMARSDGKKGGSR